MKTKRPDSHFQLWVHPHVFELSDPLLRRPAGSVRPRLTSARSCPQTICNSRCAQASRWARSSLVRAWCTTSSSQIWYVHTQMRIACAPRLPKLTCSRCESWACSSHRPCLTWQLQLRRLNEKLKGLLRRLPSAEQSRVLSSRLTWLDWATIRILPRQSKWRTLHSEH